MPATGLVLGKPARLPGLVEMAEVEPVPSDPRSPTAGCAASEVRLIRRPLRISAAAKTAAPREQPVSAALGARAGPRGFQGLRLPPPAARELARAFRAFAEVAARRKRLGLLFLIDPLRAFADAGVHLGAEAERCLRKQAYRGAADRADLYEAVRDGKARLPLFSRVRFLPPVPGTANQGGVQWPER